VSDSGAKPGGDSDHASEEFLARKESLQSAYNDLATYLARRFANRGLSLTELTAIARTSLSSAIDRFVPEQGTDFLAYATTSIVGDLKRQMRQRGWAIGTPRRADQLYRQLSEVVDPLTDRLHRSPSIANLAAALDASEEEVLEALEVGQEYLFASRGVPALSPVPEDRSRPVKNSDLPLTTEPGLAAAIRRYLPPAEREVVHLRLVENLSQVAIAEALDMPQATVSTRLATGIARLRSVQVHDEVGRGGQRDVAGPA
jgi:RNA polymerase sigma-B factor